jgi:hypothetical protein
MIVCGDFASFRWPTGKRKILLTDPPYGLGAAWKRSWHGNNGKSTLRSGAVPEWDYATADLSGLLKWADIAVICGGNFYPLPPSPCWFVWDKLQSNRGSDAELIWTNAPIKGVKVFRMSRIDAYFNKARWPKKHIAEKPVQLWEWIISMIVQPGDVVFDPFMGTGSSVVAALEAGADCSGCEINPAHFSEAQRRIEMVRR